ncbi:hypothetical protein Droror1_Dr00001627 [Drosera rotundifolia]
MSCNSLFHHFCSLSNACEPSPQPNLSLLLLLLLPLPPSPPPPLLLAFVAIPIVAVAALDDARIKCTVARVSQFLGFGFLISRSRCSSGFPGFSCCSLISCLLLKWVV